MRKVFATLVKSVGTAELLCFGLRVQGLGVWGSTRTVERIKNQSYSVYGMGGQRPGM